MTISILKNLKKYEIIIAIIIAIVGIYFNIYQIWHSRQETYFQFRPYVNLKSVKLVSKDIQIEIENRGQSPAMDIMLGVLDTEDKPITKIMTSGASLNIEDVGEVTVIGLIGDLNPKTEKLIKISFPIIGDFEKLTQKDTDFIIEVDYGDYWGQGHDHKYYLRYKEEDKTFYISDEFERESGKSRDVTIRKIL